MTDLDTKFEDSIHIEEVVPDGADDLYRPEVDTANVNQRKLIRRIDFTLVPLLAAFYTMNTLDRGAIGNARVCSAALNFGTLTDTYKSCTVWKPRLASVINNTCSRSRCTYFRTPSWRYVLVLCIRENAD